MINIYRENVQKCPLTYDLPKKGRRKQIGTTSIIYE